MLLWLRFRLTEMNKIKQIMKLADDLSNASLLDSISAALESPPSHVSAEEALWNRSHFLWIFYPSSFQEKKKKLYVEERRLGRHKSKGKHMLETHSWAVASVTHTDSPQVRIEERRSGKVNFLRPPFPRKVSSVSTLSIRDFRMWLFSTPTELMICHVWQEELLRWGQTIL